MQLMQHFATNVIYLIVTNITQNFTVQIITQKFVLHMNKGLWVRWQTYGIFKLCATTPTQCPHFRLWAVF